MAKIVIGLMRREVSDLTPEEIDLVQNCFPGDKLDWRTLHSQDHLEHARVCAEIEPAFVVLPRDKPIPATAMEQGVIHVDISRGEVLQLLPLQPQFTKYVQGLAPIAG